MHAAGVSLHPEVLSDGCHHVSMRLYVIPTHLLLETLLFLDQSAGIYVRLPKRQGRHTSA